jgi:hypothetical protein
VDGGVEAGVVAGVARVGAFGVATPVQTVATSASPG